MAKKVGAAGERQRRVEALYRRVEQLLEHAESARLALGAVIKGLREERETWSSIVSTLKARYPKAPAQLGHEFTEKTVKAMLNVHETFSEGSGIESPDGKWHIDAEQMDALGLTAAQLDKAATLATTGKLPVKKLVRAANKAMRSSKTGKLEDVASARQMVLQAMGDVKPPQLSAEEKLAAAKREEALAKQNLVRAQDRLNAAISARRDLEDAVKAQMAKSNAKLSGSKVTPRKGRKAAGELAAAPA